MKNKGKKTIPEYVKKLFWDVKKENVDIEKHSTFIIKRALDYGDVPSLKWLIRIYPDYLIKKLQILLVNLRTRILC